MSRFLAVAFVLLVGLCLCEQVEANRDAGRWPGRQQATAQDAEAVEPTAPDAGTMFDVGIAFLAEGDYVSAVRWLSLAADQGEVDAQVTLGVMYANGEGVPEDDAEAVRWYRLAADQGLADAQYNLGLRHDRGCPSSC